MSKAATVKVEHSNAAAHCQEVIAAVQSRKVNLERPESTLNLPESKIGTFSSIIIIITIIIPIIVISIIVTAVIMSWTMASQVTTLTFSTESLSLFINC